MECISVPQRIEHELTEGHSSFHLLYYRIYFEFFSTACFFQGQAGLRSGRYEGWHLGHGELTDTQTNKPVSNDLLARQEYENVILHTHVP